MHFVGNCWFLLQTKFSIEWNYFTFLFNWSFLPCWQLRSSNCICGSPNSLSSIARCNESMRMRKWWLSVRNQKYCHLCSCLSRSMGSKSMMMTEDEKSSVLSYLLFSYWADSETLMKNEGETHHLLTCIEL